MLRATVLIEEFIAVAIFSAWLYVGQGAASSATQWFVNLHVAWVLAPVGLIFLHLLAKAVYEEHITKLISNEINYKKEITNYLESSSGRVEEVRSRLGLYADRGLILAEDDLMRSYKEIREWEDGASNMIKDLLDDSFFLIYYETAHSGGHWILTGDDHNEVQKQFLVNHAKALESIAKNLTHGDLKKQ